MWTSRMIARRQGRVVDWPVIGKLAPAPTQMLFSKKNILTKGRKPLHAASRVINASSATASSAFARCWVHSTNRTSALLRTVRNQGFHRVYSTSSKGSDPNGDLEVGALAKGLPFYRACRGRCLTSLTSHSLYRQNNKRLDGDPHKMVPNTYRRGCTGTCRPTISQKDAKGGPRRRGR